MFLDPIERHTDIANIFRFGHTIKPGQGIVRGLRKLLMEAMTGNPIYEHLSRITDPSRINSAAYKRIRMQVREDFRK